MAVMRQLDDIATTGNGWFCEIYDGLRRFDMHFDNVGIHLWRIAPMGLTVRHCIATSLCCQRAHVSNQAGIKAG